MLSTGIEPTFLRVSTRPLIGWATAHASAIALAEDRSPELAFVDLRLRDRETGLDISKQLPERGVVVVLTTAQADQLSEVEHLFGVMPKPYLTETIGRGAELRGAETAEHCIRAG
jgi:hypothetical protein